MTDVTYRLVCLGSDLTGQTALTPDLARLVPGGLDHPDIRPKYRLGIERTDWVPEGGRMPRGAGLRPYRTILIEAESRPGEWTIGTNPPELSESGVQSFFKKKAVA
jgi:hypothetical protein